MAGVLGGRILPGARLPSTRKLAGYLGISRLTVSLACQELVSQGYLEASERSGYRIAEATPVARLRRARTTAAGPPAASTGAGGSAGSRSPSGSESRSTGGAIRTPSSTARPT
ncbi:GntR family transcriptional regulator [Amaricoccus sp.]|uniref:GntR family transcriptional regulator n=1 Tax=Amaricoccus sp. TaxID=1872485 RepID=UPI0039E4FAC6